MSKYQIIYVNTKKEAYELITNPIKLFLLLYSKYGDIEDDYNMLKINELIFNKSTHFNILFKEYLFNCKEEYLNRIYHFHEIFSRMNKLNDYYHNYHKFFCKPYMLSNNFNLLLKKYYEKQAEIFYKNNYSQNLTNSQDNNSNNSSISLSNIDNETDIKTIFDKKTRNLIDDSNLKFTITLDSSRNLNFNHNELCSKRSKDASFLPIVQNLLNYNKKTKKEKNKKINLKFISKKNIILFNNININHINYTNKNNNNLNNNNKNNNNNNNNNNRNNNNIKNYPTKLVKNNLFLLSPKLKNIFSNNYITNLNEIKKKSESNNNNHHNHNNKYIKNNLNKFPFYNYRIINTKINNINSLTNLSGNLSKQKSKSKSKSNRNNTNIYNKNMRKNHSTKNLMKQNSNNNLRNKKLNNKNKIIKNETFEFKLFKNNTNYPFNNYLLQSKKNTMSLNSNTINFTNNTNITNNKKPRVLNMKKTFSRNKSIVNLNSSSKNIYNQNHFYNNMNRKKTKSLDEKVNYYDNKYNIYSISIKNQIEDMLKNTKIFISKKNKDSTYSLLSLKNTYNSNKFNNKKLKSNSMKILNFVNKKNNIINNNNSNNQYK